MFFFYFIGPTPGHQFRAIGIGQRPYLDPSFTTHLRELETFRRKAPITSLTPSLTSHSNSNGNSNSDCQDYKLNAPQVQGKFQFFFVIN